MDERLKDLLRVAREHYQRRDYDRAEPALRQALAVHGEFADVHDMLGVILHDRGDLVGARFHFANAARINPSYTEALMNLAVTHADLGEYDAAGEVYRRIQSEHTGTTADPFIRGKIANMHADLAQAYLDAGSQREAIAELRRAVDLCPRFPDLQARLGTLYRDQGNHALARDHYSAAIEANPRYAPAHVLLGLTMLALGTPDQAVACFRTALSVDPDNKSAKMYLRLVEAQRNARASRQTGRREGIPSPT